MSSALKSAYRKVLPDRLRQILWNAKRFNSRSAFDSVYYTLVHWKNLTRCHGPSYAKKVAKRAQFWRAENSGGALWYRLFSATCDVCKSIRIAPFTNATIKKLDYRFYRCKDCEFIFVHPKPVVVEYEDGPLMELGAGAQEYYRMYLRTIEKYMSNKGRLIEIGFGDAGFLKLAHDSGWEVHGAELSQNCIRHARETLGLPNIKQGFLEDIRYPDNYFDVVTAFNFIEHVADLRGTLSELRRILRPGGLLILLCPNLGGLVHRLIPELFGKHDPLNISWVPPYHVSYFNKSNFKLLLQNMGFNVMADESRGAETLWLQHEATYGPSATRPELEKLLSESEASSFPYGDARTNQYYPQVVELMRKQMVWSMASSLLSLEPALGAECAVFYIAEKPNAPAASTNEATSSHELVSCP